MKQEEASESGTNSSGSETGAPVSYIRHVKRVIVGVVGGTVLVIGLCGIVLPLVPAIVLIPAGLAILATEFVWARRWLKRAKSMFQRNNESSRTEE